MNLAITQTTALSTTERHSLLHVVLLHLAPGVVITLVFVILARITAAQGMPASLALLITWLIAGIPLLLGILFGFGARTNFHRFEAVSTE